MSSARAALVDGVARRLAGIELFRPLRVCIDGPDAAGKTMLGDELASHIEARGRPVVRASIDGFHRPRAERYRRGSDSPAGYYLDSFDYPALRKALLDPLGPGGDLLYRNAVFDFRADLPREVPARVAPEDAVLVFDGVFLLRPELNDFWDFRIFLDVHYEEILRRVVERDRHLFGSRRDVADRYRQRYLPGQKLYHDSVNPWTLADIVVHNSDPAHPFEVSNAGVSRVHNETPRDG